MFHRNCYVKLVDTRGNFRFGYISQVQERGSMLIIDLNEEGLSKIEWDNEYAQYGGRDYQIRNFDQLLTDTEKKIIPLLACQSTTKAIAEAMGICPVTVRAHIRELKIKLQVDTREQLYAYAQGIQKKLGNEPARSRRPD